MASSGFHAANSFLKTAIQQAAAFFLAERTGMQIAVGIYIKKRSPAPRAPCPPLMVTMKYHNRPVSIGSLQIYFLKKIG
jgi:hypothetical protein